MTRYPETRAELAQHELSRTWWYYSMELCEGIVTPGQYAVDTPFLPRMLMRSADLQDASCLDMGTMEGIMPTLMHRGGARRVLATDFDDAQLKKLEAVKHYHKADFEFRSVGLMYDLAAKLNYEQFDFVNCSGLLYHVLSPINVLLGIRPLLKKGGLLLVSTNVVTQPGYSMEFNSFGRIQMEANTFWYPTVELLDYMLRCLALYPVDCMYTAHSTLTHSLKLVFDKPSGYLSILCVAGDVPGASLDDHWMGTLAPTSWEIAPIQWQRLKDAPRSSIAFQPQITPGFERKGLGGVIDLWAAVQGTVPLGPTSTRSDTHTLMLDDRS